MNNDTTETHVVSIEEISACLSSCTDPKLLAVFFSFFLTPSELEKVAMRWQLVKQIEQGVTQREIAKNLGLSLCKITRGSRELKNTDPAFKKMLDDFYRQTLPKE